MNPTAESIRDFYFNAKTHYTLTEAARILGSSPAEAEEYIAFIDDISDHGKAPIPFATLQEALHFHTGSWSIECALGDRFEEFVPGLRRSRAVTVHVPEYIVCEIEAEANETGVSPSDRLRELVVWSLEERVNERLNGGIVALESRRAHFFPGNVPRDTAN